MRHKTHFTTDKWSIKSEYYIQKKQVVTTVMKQERVTSFCYILNQFKLISIKIFTIFLGSIF